MTIQEQQKIWHAVNTKFKIIDNSDLYFMLSVGWILGILNNPGPNGKVREPQLLDAVDFARLNDLYKLI